MQIALDFPFTLEFILSYFSGDAYSCAPLFLFAAFYSVCVPVLREQPPQLERLFTLGLCGGFTK